MEHTNIAQAVPQQQEVVQQQEVKTMEETPKLNVNFANVESYKAFIDETKEKLQELVSSGYMGEEVANRLLSEFSYTGFNQMVQVKIG